MKNILIFGGSSDIGQEIIKVLDQRNIIATYNKNRPANNLAKLLKCDLTKKADIDKVYNSIETLDEVIFSSMPEILNEINDFQGFEYANELLKGHIYALTRSMEKLNAGGKIITMSGQSADNGLPAAPFMAANMAYMNNLAKSNNAFNKIKMCDFQLGPVDTKMWDRVSEEKKDLYGRDNFIKPEIIANYIKTILDQEIMPTKIILDGYYSLK